MYWTLEVWSFHITLGVQTFCDVTNHVCRLASWKLERKAEIIQQWMCKQPYSVLTLYMHHSTQWNSNIQLEKWEEKLTWTKGGLWFYVCLVTCSSGPSVRKPQLSAPSLNSSNVSIHSKLPAKVKAVTVWAAFVWVCQHFHALLKCDSRVWEEAVLQCWRGDYRLPTQSAGLTRALLLCQTFQREGRWSLRYSSLSLDKARSDRKGM